MGCSVISMFRPLWERGEGDIRIDTEQGIVVFVDSVWTSVLEGTTIDVVKEILDRKINL